MDPSPDINEVVEQLETALMPRLAEFGHALMSSNADVRTETFSHRHADVLHNLGLSCYPVGSDFFDPRRIALIVTVITLKGLSIKAYVAWQTFDNEGETAIYNTTNDRDLARFYGELESLLGVFAAAVSRGAPSAHSAAQGNKQ